jgi:ABC-type transport system involved in multi-copper enzyme maturation permease subunit
MQLLLLGLELSPGLESWFTPLWLVGIGCLIGVLCVSLLWVASGLLSKLDKINMLMEEPKRAFFLALIGGLVLTAIAMPFQLGTVSMPTGGTSEDTILTLLAKFVGFYSIASFIVYSVIVFAWKRTSRELPLVLKEGMLMPIFLLVLTMSVIGLLGTIVAPDTSGIFSSLLKLPTSGVAGFNFEIPGEADLYEGDVEIRIGDVGGMEIVTDGAINASFTPFDDLPEQVDLDVITEASIYRVSPYEPGILQTIPAEKDTALLANSQINKVYLRNLGPESASVALYIRYVPQYAQVASIPITAFGVIFIFLVYVVQRMAAPRMFAVALSTFKSEVAQPLFVLILGGGVFALIAFIWIPYNTFGEDIKMLKDTGLTLILVLSIVLALWSASTSVADEIEGRTALTVLSKPLNRRSFVIGKYAGIVWTLLLVYLIFSVVFMAAVAYKPIYDAKEASLSTPEWQTCYLEMIRLVPGLVLAFMEALVFTALSVAISTRLPLLANMTICLVIYALGHLTPLVVESSVEGAGFGIVRFFAQLIATIFPNLELFNIQAAISAGVDVPFVYLGWAFSYCAVYSIIAMLLALIMFEDRDLA